MVYSNLSYIQSGLYEKAPAHIRNLWNIKSNNAHILRDRGMMIEQPFTKKDWIRNLAPSAQARLWNLRAKKLDWDIKPVNFKATLKKNLLADYEPRSSQ